MRRGLLLSGLLLALFWMGPVGDALAQTGTVRGRVLDASTGEPLPGASVVLLQDGTLVTGSASDVDGRYTIQNVPPGTYTLRATFVGYEPFTQEVAVRAGATTEVIARLQPSAIELEGVAVTALGFRINRDELGTATSAVEGEQLVESGEISVLKALSAKAAGLNVTAFGGDPGAGARIVIRGPKTIQGDNQPLIVIDGVPVNNSTQGTGVAGVQQQSRLNDLNPADIASVEVLKGAAAAALYGSRAQNGVIVITTKRGNYLGRMNVSYQSSVAFDEVNRTVPLQTAYGQGVLGQFRGTLLGAAVGRQLSWGDRIADRPGGEDERAGTAAAVGKQTGRVYYDIPVGTPDNPHGGKRSKEVYDHSREIFKTGLTFENALSISGGDENGRYYLSIGNVYQDGVIKENSNYQRTSIRLSAERSLSERLTVGGSANYIRVNSDRIQQGSNISGLLLGALRSAPDFDNTDYLVDYYPQGLDGPFIPNRHRSYRNPLGASVNPAYDNPFFTINRNRDATLVNRIIGDVNASYDALDWLNLTARVGVDHYTDRRYTFFPIYNASNPNGSLSEANLGYYSVNVDLIARAARQINPDIRLNVTAGANFNHRENDQLSGALNTFVNPIDLRSLENAETQNISAYTEQVVRRTFGTFGEVDLALYDQLFIKLTGRLDYASTFGPEAKSSFFYPSVQVAWQFSDLLGPNPVLSFGKLRASYAEVGREPDPYLAFTYFVNADFFDGYTGTTLNAAAYGGGFQRSARAASPAIKPERTREFEVGADLRFFNDRYSLSATYYFNRSTDLIFNVDVPPSTGFLSQTQNAAETENWGVELSLDANWINTRDFSWNTYVNWWKNENTVVSLAGVQEVSLAGFIGSTSSLVEGEPFGVLYGDRWRRESFEPLTDAEKAEGYSVAPDGRILDPFGFPVAASTSGVIGDPNPDWSAGIGNRFRYKNLSLDILWDFRMGGDVWNGTKGALYYFGTHGDQDWTTTLTPEQASTIRNYLGLTAEEMVAFGYWPVTYRNEDGSYTVRGYIHDFGAGPVLIDETYFWSGPGSGFTGPTEQFIEDGSYIRLREVTLSYNWRGETVRRLGLSSIDFAVTGRNLLLITDYTGIDPETNLTGPSNGQGLDFFNNPNTRSYRFTVRFNY